MRALVCVEGRGWEAVIRGAARYLPEGEAIVACTVDERGPKGYGLAIRGLLGRRGHPAEDLLAEAGALLGRLRPHISVRTLLLRGVPNETLARAVEEERAEAVFVGRGAPGSGRPVMVSGVVTAWRRNTPGDLDGLYLEDGTEVRFPPHRAAEVRRVAREVVRVEVEGGWRGRHVHAYRVSDPVSGTSVEAHKPPGEGPGKKPLGHTARFIADHASCAVVVLGAWSIPLRRR